MDFIVKEADVVKLVLGYLKHNRCYESLCSLVLESNVSFDTLDGDVSYLQRVVLQGRWDDVERVLSAMNPDLSPHVSMQLNYFMRRQKYLELLSWQGGGQQRMAFPPWRPLKADSGNRDVEGNIEMGVILQHLNTLKGLCSTSDFNSLCAFLTLDRLENHPEYHKWTVAQGRWTCFTHMMEALSPSLSQGSSSTLADSGLLENGLMKTVAMSLAYQQALSTDKPFDSNHTHQAAVLSAESGYIVPARDGPNGTVSADGVEISANIVLQSPVTFRQQFDDPFAAPRVVRPSMNSPNRNASVAAPQISPPRELQTEVHRNLFGAHHNQDLRAQPVLEQQYTEPRGNLQGLAPAPQMYYPEVLHHPAGLQPQPVFAQPVGPAAVQYAPPASQYVAPQYAPALMQPQAQNVFAFAPESASVVAGYGARPQPYPPAAVPAQYAQAPPHQQRLSIEVADGSAYPSAGYVPSVAPVSANNHAPSAQYGAPSSHQGPFAYGSFTPNGQGNPRSVAPYFPDSAPNGYVTQNPHVVQPVEATQPPGSRGQSRGGREPYGQPSFAEGPTSVHSAYSRAPLAWTVEDEEVQQPAEPSTRTEPASKVIHVASVPVEAPPPTAFTVGEPEVKVKPMPPALRRKMLADQEAAAAAEEERQRIQAENLAAERASSRGRSRSAPRGPAAGSNVSFSSQPGAGPPSNSRPPSAVRTRGLLKPAEDVPVDVVVTKDRSGSASNAVRKSHDRMNPETTARPPSAGSQASSKRDAGRPSASRSEQPAPAPAERARPQPQVQVTSQAYIPHVLFESKCPLRCASVLSAGPERTQLAVGSNAKSIYTMSFAGDAMRGRSPHAGMDATAAVSMDLELKDVHNGSVYCMDWHAGMRLLVSGSNDKALKISNPSTGQISGPLKEHNGTVRVVKFLQSGASGNSALVASAGAGDCKPRLWDAQRGSLIRSLTEHPESVHGLVWVNETILVTGCDDGCVIGHDLRSARPAWSYNLNDILQNDSASRRGVCCLALLRSPQAGAADGFASPHSVPMVAGCVGGFVTIFNAVNGQVFSHNQLHQEDVRSICVLSASSRPNGAQNYEVLTGSYDRTAAVWSISSDAASNATFGPQPVVLRGHTDKVLNAVSFNGPGLDNKNVSSQVVTTGADGKVIYWNQQYS